MKWIKKIASTPLETIARVINSLDSGADATTNAPSIKAVNDALDLKASENDLLSAVANLETEIAKKPDKNDMFLLQSYSYSYTANAGENLSVSASDLGITAIEGYTPIAFREINAGSRYMNVYLQYTRASGTVIGMRNTHTAEVSNTLDVIIVFARTDLF